MARKHFEEMVGEGFRDVGILVLVFALLDRIVNGSITAWWTVAAVAVSFFLLSGWLLHRKETPGMSNYISLIIGTASGVVAFTATLLWIKYKERTIERRKEEQQRYLFEQRQKEENRLPAAMAGRG